MVGQNRSLCVVALAVAVLTVGGCDVGKVAVSSSVRGQAVAKYSLFEVLLNASTKPANPFVDASACATFTSPSGKAVQVEGFYYGGDQWRVRFVPREPGRWQYSAVLEGAGKSVRQTGAFQCAGVSGHGFLRVSKSNGYRMEYEDGTPFYPIGIQTCDFLQPDFDGPTPDGKWQSATPKRWATAFKGAVNLVRTQIGQGTTAGCALPLIPYEGTKAPPGTPVVPRTPDRYDTDLAARMDEAFAIYRGHDMAQMLILFQDMSLWGNGGSGRFGLVRDLVNNKSLRAANLPLQEKYIRYIVARFGCFVDIWELFNEDSYSPDDYLAHVASIVRQADPYGHIITTNYARPKAPWCEVVTWHEYMGIPANEVDAYINQQIAVFKSHGKCVINTEFGNQGSLSNYDPVKWRIAVWTAFMNESSMLFWSASGRKLAVGENQGNGNANAYIGPDSRQHFRVLNEFTRGMPVDMKPVAIGFHSQRNMRTYALSDGQVTAIYVHHFDDHTVPLEDRGAWGLMVQTGPGRFVARWTDPADGRELRRDELQAQQQFLNVPRPPVTIDAACRIDRVDAKVPSSAPAGR